MHTRTQRFIKKTVKFYNHLPSEIKLPFRLLLFLFLLLEKFTHSLKATIGRIGQGHPPHKRRKTSKHTAKPLRIDSRFSFSIATKVKYFSLGIFFSFLFIFLPILFVIFLQDLPQPEELSHRQIAQTTKLYDRNHTLLYEIYASQNRTLISLSDVPKYLQQATLSIEDKNFYKHPGFDLTSIIRALKENLSRGGAIQGGSTITQQLIKSSLLTSERNISRKVKELVLAFWTERIYSKSQILEMYFNQVPYGGTAWGIEAASEVYFGKHVNQLDLSESAFLAGLTQAPSDYSPFGPNPTLWKVRQKEVLKRMVANGYISKQQSEQAAKETLSFKKQDLPLRAPHFVMYVKDLLVKKYGLAAVEKGGLEVTTTLDLTKQESTEKIVREEVANDAYLHLTNGAVVITDPQSGDIIAMVGSKDYNDPDGGKVNIATAQRQPGSTVKVITYSAGLMHGFTAATILEDTPTSFPNPWGAPYTPVNYDGAFHGRVPLRFALANSLNIPAVKMLQKVGVPTMIALANHMGMTSWDKPDQYGLSVTLGGAEATMLDMATVFGTLSNGGNKVTLDPFLLIKDYTGRTLEKKSVVQTRAMPTGVAYIISNIISDNQARSMEFGSNSPLYIPGHTVSVKTGTSDNKRDNWTVGYTKDFVVTVWVGNNDNSPMSPVLASGITGAAPIWHKVMVNLLDNKPDQKQQIPSDVTMKTCFGKPEYFLKGTENSVNCGGNFPTPKVYSLN